MAEIDSKKMEVALKEQFVPALRRAGFKGSFPHFYRESENFVALLNVQFFSAGGSFCVNLSYADPERKNVTFRPETEARKLEVSQTSERLRLGSTSTSKDNWFSFGRTSYGEIRGTLLSVSEIIGKLNELFLSQAEPWWALKCR